MTDQQFQQMLSNRRLRGARPALDEGLASELIAAAATARRRTTAAEAAWARLAKPDWRACAQVESLEAGVLTIVTADWATCAALRASRLGRELARSLSGLASVRFVVRGTEGLNATESHE